LQQKTFQMAHEVEPGEAWIFLAELDAEMQKGRNAESFFRILSNQDKLRKHVRIFCTFAFCLMSCSALSFALSLMSQFLGYGTALDGSELNTRPHSLPRFLISIHATVLILTVFFSGAVVQHVRRGVVNGIAKPWLQDSNCCTPYSSPPPPPRFLIHLAILMAPI